MSRHIVYFPPFVFIFIEVRVNNYCDALIIYQYYLLLNTTVKNFYKNRVPVFELCCYDNCSTLKGNNEIITDAKEMEVMIVGLPYHENIITITTKPNMY